MGPIRQAVICCSDDTFYLITTRPLRITWMPIDPPDVLPDLWFNRLQQKVVDRIERVGENEL